MIDLMENRNYTEVKREAQAGKLKCHKPASKRRRLQREIYLFLYMTLLTITGREKTSLDLILLVYIGYLL